MVRMGARSYGAGAAHRDREGGSKARDPFIADEGDFPVYLALTGLVDDHVRVLP